MGRWLARLRDRGLGTQTAVLTAAVLLVYALVAPVAVSLSGAAGLAAAAVAAALCLTAAVLALVVCRRFRGPDHTLQSILAGMLLRMGIPMAVGFFLQMQGGPLAEAGVMVYLVVFYPVTLFVETALLLPSASRPAGRRDASGNLVT